MTPFFTRHYSATPRALLWPVDASARGGFIPQFDHFTDLDKNEFPRLSISQARMKERALNWMEFYEKVFVPRLAQIGAHIVDDF